MRVNGIGHTRAGTPCIEVAPRFEGGAIRGIISNEGKSVEMGFMRLTGKKVSQLIEGLGPSEITDEILPELLERRKGVGNYAVTKGVVASFDQGNKVTYIPGPFSGVLKDIKPAFVEN